MIPGLSINCLLTSLTTSWAVRPTAEHAHALNRKISIEPNNPPTKTSGMAISTCKVINIKKQWVRECKHDEEIKVVSTYLLKRFMSKCWHLIHISTEQKEGCECRGSNGESLGGSFCGVPNCIKKISDLPNTFRL